MVVRDDVIGVLVALRLRGEAEFTRAESERGWIFASQVALALSNARLYRSLNVAHSEAQAAETRLRAIMNGAQDAIVTLDIDATILDLNSAAERVFGHEHALAVGRNYYDLMVPEGLQKELAPHVEKCLAPGDGASPVISGRCRRRSGELFDVEMTLRRIQTPEGIRALLVRS